MEELLCTIEFFMDGKKYVAKINSDIGGLREYRGDTFDDLLSQVMLELEEEFEGMSEL
ncbi:MAG: hypothetical protein RXP30_02050 [Thermoplasmata archaeon]|jgi:hypothetical protein|nr:hypothetical protein [Thermoplasmata archaeon]